MSKRSQPAIIRDILEVVDRDNEGTKPTHIMYGANLSHTMLERYLKHAVEQDMVETTIEDDNTRYHITEKGKRFLKEYDKISTFLETFGLDEF